MFLCLTDYINMTIWLSILPYTTEYMVMFDFKSRGVLLQDSKSDHKDFTHVFVCGYLYKS